jgi:hypothetical protein
MSLAPVLEAAGFVVEWQLDPGDALAVRLLELDAAKHAALDIGHDSFHSWG